jgi:hypothetical protein
MSDSFFNSGRVREAILLKNIWEYDTCHNHVTFALADVSKTDRKKVSKFKEYRTHVLRTDPMKLLYSNEYWYNVLGHDA